MIEDEAPLDDERDNFTDVWTFCYDRGWPSDCVLFARDALRWIAANSADPQARSRAQVVLDSYDLAAD